MQKFYVIGYKLNGTQSNDDLGYVVPVWVFDESQNLVRASEGFDCQSGKVFVVRGYKSLDEKYAPDELFRLPVRENRQYDSSRPDSCRYIADGDEVEQIEPRHIAEVLKVPLPDANDPRIQIDRSRTATRNVFLEDGGSLFGLFEVSAEEQSGVANVVKLSLSKTPMLIQLRYRKRIQVHEIASVPRDTFATVNVGGRPRTFVTRVSDLLQRTPHEYRLFMSDAEVIRAGTDLLERSSPQVFRKEGIALYRKNALSQTYGANSEELLDAFFRLLEQERKYFEEAKSAIEYQIKSPSGRKLIQELLTEEPELLRPIESAMYERMKVAAEDGLRAIQSRSQEEEAKVRALRSQYEELAKKHEAEQKAVKEQLTLAEAIAKVDAATSDKRAELDRVRATIEKESTELEKLRVDLNLARDTHAVKTYIEQLRNEGEIARRALESTQQSAIASDARLLERLNDMRPFVDVLTGVRRTPDNVIAKLKLTPRSPDRSTPNASLASRDQYLSELQRYFAGAGRDLDRAEIANLVICLQQTFLTVLAGLPGTGKTSLAHLLAKALGLNDAFIRISVGRGWTSHRDLLGYYNPLAGRFEAAQTQFYDFLRRICGKPGEPADINVNAIALLDEANLSPIEHYWSSFVPMTDDVDGRRLPIGTDTLILPRGFRFLATINFDNTTEPLSPRILDRVPIVSLETVDVSEMGAPVEANVPEPVGTDALDEWFGTGAPESQEGDRARDQLEGFLEVARDVKFGRPFTLSQRKQFQISEYLKRAAPMLRADDELLAPDLAIKQFILPLLEGTGDKFRSRLEALLAACEQERFTQSADRLRAMIEVGKQDLDNFSFFVW
jgi:hypothetical protein